MRGLATPAGEACPGQPSLAVSLHQSATSAWVANQHPPRSLAWAISLSGHSAGAHLCAAALAEDWQARGLDLGSLRGAVKISGIYDPGWAMGTSVNAELQLTPEIALRHNFEGRTVTAHCPTHLFVGGSEPWRWVDLTFQYAHHLRREGHDPEVHVLPGYNHFDILDQYLDQGSPIFNAVLRAARS